VGELALRETGSGDDLILSTTLTPAAQRAIQDAALRQNISTLHNRVNELGVAEPVIQQQGADRIVVQLPGVQDVARAKTLIGRTATLEIRLVDQDAMAAGTPGAVTVPQRDGQVVKQIPLKREIVATGTQLNGASATLDQNQRPAVSVRLDEAGGRSMRTASREIDRASRCTVATTSGMRGDGKFSDGPTMLIEANGLSCASSMGTPKALTPGTISLWLTP